MCAEVEEIQISFFRYEKLVFVIFSNSYFHLLSILLSFGTLKMSQELVLRRKNFEAISD